MAIDYPTPGRCSRREALVWELAFTPTKAIAEGMAPAGGASMMLLWTVHEPEMPPLVHAHLSTAQEAATPRISLPEP
jgi:hypothetical protein